MSRVFLDQEEAKLEAQVRESRQAKRAKLEELEKKTASARGAGGGDR